MKFRIIFPIFYSAFLFPKPDIPSEEQEDEEQSDFHGTCDGKYELFSKMNTVIKEEMKNLIESGNHFLVVFAHFFVSSVKIR